MRPTRWEDNPWRKWYWTGRWKKIRAQQLARHPLCAMCQPRITAATVCDHITPHKGDQVKFWSGPFQSLCAACHSALKQQMERSGVVRGCDERGMPCHWV